MSEYVVYTSLDGKTWDWNSAWDGDAAKADATRRVREIYNTRKLLRFQVDAGMFFFDDDEVEPDVLDAALYTEYINTRYVPLVDPIERMERMHDPGYIYDLTHPQMDRYEAGYDYYEENYD